MQAWQVEGQTANMYFYIYVHVHVYTLKGGEINIWGAHCERCVAEKKVASIPDL